MKIPRLFAGLALLGLAILGVIWWGISFDMLSDVFTHGTPVYFGHGIPGIPGVLFGLIAVAVPSAFLATGVWVLLSSFEEKSAKHDE